MTQRLPSSSSARDKELQTALVSERKKVYSTAHLFTPQSPNSERPECKVIIQRSLIVAEEGSPEENKPCSLKQHYKHQSPEGRATGWQPRNKPICMTFGRLIDSSVLQGVREKDNIVPFSDSYLKDLVLVLEFLIFFQKFKSVLLLISAF